MAHLNPYHPPPTGTPDASTSKLARVWNAFILATGALLTATALPMIATSCDAVFSGEPVRRAHFQVFAISTAQVLAAIWAIDLVLLALSTFNFRRRRVLWRSVYLFTILSLVFDHLFNHVFGMTVFGLAIVAIFYAPIVLRAHGWPAVLIYGFSILRSGNGEPCDATESSS